MLTEVIPSYAYYQYNDDDNIRAWFDSYNTIAQQYVDWFVNINLPVWTNPQLSGTLLDWIAAGIYGKTRQTLPVGTALQQGPYATWLYGQGLYAQYKSTSSGTFYETTDDIFKRILTWHLYKADGNIINIRWLKRRIMRFLFGTNGADIGTDNSNKISVIIIGNVVYINMIVGSQTLKSAALYAGFLYGSMPFGYGVSMTQSFTILPYYNILKAAIDAGVLELPFGYTYAVNIIL